ncbi:MAG: tetratricopeptide repeat protein, partial [Telluria sp.]
AQASAGAPPEPAPAAAPDSAAIRVARSVTPSQVDPSLQSGFNQFNAGNVEGARRSYGEVLARDANNRDALLGMAAIAQKQSQFEQAQLTYQRLLELDPNDADAIAGLASVRPADPGQTESRLRRALQRTPDAAPVLFTLGNLYAQQRRWAEAQQAYFRAYTAAPGNADYAFNLAVGLDRMNQGKLALTYYQRALALARDGIGNFNQDAVRTRIAELGGQ